MTNHLALSVWSSLVPRVSDCLSHLITMNGIHTPSGNSCTIFGDVILKHAIDLLDTFWVGCDTLFHHVEHAVWLQRWSLCLHRQCKSTFQFRKKTTTMLTFWTPVQHVCNYKLQSPLSESYVLLSYSNWPNFFKPLVSLVCSQSPTSGPYSEPNESTAHIPILYF